jgi:hypothetical protein
MSFLLQLSSIPSIFSPTNNRRESGSLEHAAQRAVIFLPPITARVRIVAAFCDREGLIFRGEFYLLVVSENGG